ncbi:MAG: TetR family transcriptional regulator, partial [Gammaproteobacteria bacterium]|nr:TetR family transcriptional regulator [Gammaproteobacteria bacterium]
MVSTISQYNDPSSELRWQRRKESRPSEIIKAAFDLFTEKGFSATKMDEIARKAGISKGSLYNYFTSKEAIFEAVVTDDIIPIVDQVEETIASNKEASSETIRNLIHGMIAHTQGTRLEIIPKLILSESGNFPNLTKFYVDQVIKRVRSIVEKIIQKGIEEREFVDCDPGVTARLLLAPIVQAQIWNHSLKSFDDPYDAELYISTHLQIFLQGIKREHT